MKFKEFLEETKQVDLNKAFKTLQKKGWVVYFFDTEAQAKKFFGVTEIIKPGFEIAFKRMVCLEPSLAKQLSNSQNDALYSAYEKIS